MSSADSICQSVCWSEFATTLAEGLFLDEQVYQAPAKLNLRLKVLGRRSDGYHLLSLLNATSSLVDTVSLRLRRDCEVLVETRPETALVVASKDNLVTKAFTQFWRALGCESAPLGLHALIDKRIPVGGGLGGGSSDAGALLRFLVKQLGAALQSFAGLSQAELATAVMKAAVAVGADVPYAYRGGACWVTGIGEVVRPLPVGQLWPGDVLVSVPAAAVPTAQFYDFYRSRHPVLPTVIDGAMESYLASGFDQLPVALIENDFESDVCALCPAVGEALRLAREFFPDTTSLTGSGSALFSLVRPEHAGRVSDFIEQAAKANITVHRTTLIG